MKTVGITNFKQFLDEVKIEAVAQGWELINDVTKEDTFRDLIFKNENGMYVSLSEGQFLSGNIKNIIFANFFESYNPALTEISNNTGAFPNSHNETDTNVRDKSPMLPLIDNSMNVFMFINKYKMCFVVKVDQQYLYLYVGEGNRLGTFEQYKQPWLASGNTHYSNSSIEIDSFFDLTYSTIIKNINSVNTNISFRYPTFNGDYPDFENKNILIPILLANDESYIQNVEDNFFVSSKTGLISENILTFDSVDYIVFRSSPTFESLMYYIAIKK